jgi:hypothetical protein
MKPTRKPSRRLRRHVATIATVLISLLFVASASQAVGAGQSDAQSTTQQNPKAKKYYCVVNYENPARKVWFGPYKDFRTASNKVKEYQRKGYKAYVAVR